MSAMTQRAIVGIFADSDRDAIKTQLKALGAIDIRDPSSSSPDVFVVTLPADSQIDGYLNSAQQIKGVRYAEADAWQTTF